MDTTKDKIKGKVINWKIFFLSLKITLSLLYICCLLRGNLWIQELHY